MIIKNSPHLLDALPNLSYILFDSNGTILRYNDTLGILPFKQESDVIGQHFSSCYLTEHIELLDKLIEEAELKGKSSFSGWRNFNSIPKWFISDVIKVDLDHSSFGFLKTYKDYTSEKRIKGILEASEKYSKIGTWSVDVNTLEVDWSKGVGDIHELPENEIPDVTEGITYYLEGYDRDKITEVFTKCVEEGIPYSEELRIRTAKGNVRWVKATGYPDIKDGKAVKVYGTFIDIHDQKERQFALEKSLQEFRKTFEYSANGMAMIGKDGKWLKVNSRTCEIIGYDEKELSSMNFQEITHPDDLEKDLELLNDLIKDRITRYEIEKRYYHKNGNIIWINLAVTKIIDGNDFYFISQITDITKRVNAINELKKRNEILKEQNHELEQFAYITSHDLQEPLRTIRSFIKLFEKKYVEQIDDKGQKYIEFIVDASNRMSLMIHSLLEYNRIGKRNSVKENVNLDELISVVEADLNKQISDYNAAINYKNLGSVYAYKLDMKMLFQNLLSNAIKFSRKGIDPVININVKKKGKKTTISIADNGIGIDEQFKSKVFLIFQRLHKRDKFEGSGIGLANCKKIVELHNGKIWFEKNELLGTTFYITI